jgi:hypothetical protein
MMSVESRGAGGIAAGDFTPTATLPHDGPSALFDRQSDSDDPSAPDPTH